MTTNSAIRPLLFGDQLVTTVSGRQGKMIFISAHKSHPLHRCSHATGERTLPCSCFPQFFVFADFEAIAERSPEHVSALKRICTGSLAEGYRFAEELSSIYKLEIIAHVDDSFWRSVISHVPFIAKDSMVRDLKFNPVCDIRSLWRVFARLPTSAELTLVRVKIMAHEAARMHRLLDDVWGEDFVTRPVEEPPACTERKLTPWDEYPAD